MKEKVQIVKIGGNVIDNERLLSIFLRDFSRIPGRKVLVHGGGKIATDISRSLGHEIKVVDGRRITDKNSLEVVTMVFAGLLNKKIVALLQGYQCDALGLTGADANTVLAKKRPVKEIDYGFVGDIVKVNTDRINSFLKMGITPVFGAITYDGKGQLFNTNADTMTATLAASLSGKYETELIYCFEKRGILMDLHDDESVIHRLTYKQYEDYKKKKVFSAGMLPKLETAFDSIKNGVKRVLIGNAGDILTLSDHKVKNSGSIIVWK